MTDTQTHADPAVEAFRAKAQELLAKLDEEGPRSVPQPATLSNLLRIALGHGWIAEGVVLSNLEAWERPGVRFRDYLRGAQLTQSDAHAIGKALFRALDEPAHTWAGNEVMPSEAVSLAEQLVDAPPTGIQFVPLNGGKPW